MEPNLKGMLLILVQSNIDVEQCIREIDDSPVGDNEADWMVKHVVRNDLSHSTLVEEIVLAGHPVSKVQEYLYGHASLSSCLDQIEGRKFHVAGHLYNHEIRRIAGMKNVNRWADHLSDVPTSANVLRNTCGSMISSFEEGENGLEAISPIMEKLQDGDVIIELRQAKDSKELSDAMYTTLSLFKRVAEQQSIDTIICHVGMSQKGKSGLFLPKHRLMTVCSKTPMFNAVHMQDIDSVTCVSKHLSAHLSGSDAALMPAFTDQFANCDASTAHTRSVCFRAHENTMTLYRIPDETKYDTRVIEFTVPSNEDIEIEYTVRALANQMSYMVHNPSEEEVQPAFVSSGVVIEQDFFRAVAKVCGKRVVDVSSAPTVQQSLPAKSSPQTILEDDVPSPEAVVEAQHARRAPLSEAAAPAAWTLARENASIAAEMDKIRDDAIVSSDSKDMEIKELKAKLAHMENAQSAKSMELSECYSDVKVLRNFSQSPANEQGMITLAKQQLVASTGRIRELERRVTHLVNAQSQAHEARAAHLVHRDVDKKDEDAEPREAGDSATPVATLVGVPQSDSAAQHDDAAVDVATTTATTQAPRANIVETIRTALASLAYKGYSAQQESQTSESSAVEDLNPPPIPVKVVSHPEPRTNSLRTLPGIKKLKTLKASKPPVSKPPASKSPASNPDLRAVQDTPALVSATTTKSRNTRDRLRAALTKRNGHILTSRSSQPDMTRAQKMASMRRALFG